MILIPNLKLPHNFDFSNITGYIAKRLALKPQDIALAKIHKKSIDARKRTDVHFCVSFLVELNIDEQKFLNTCTLKGLQEYKKEAYKFPICRKAPSYRPIIIGFGPAGIFAALTLSKAGLKPIVFELGEDVDQRARDIEEFIKTGRLNTSSNIQFGEGGAGTFSDGKLTTGIKDIRCQAVLEQFYSHGAEESILYDAKPHIGTDILRNVIKNLRNEIISLGGEIRFGAKLIDISIENGALCGITINNRGKREDYPCQALILAIGHSSRDTFYLLKEKGAEMERKPFSVGARIEHKQRDIDASQLGSFADFPEFCPTDYKLSTHLPNGRGVYTFCMCPGGEVVNASSEEGGVCVNGMSYNARSLENANSALLVSVNPDDFSGDDPLSGIEFQRSIEKAAYNIGSDYSPICQTVGDFLQNKPSKKEGKIKPSAKGGATFGDIREVLPSFITESLCLGIIDFEKKLKGFSSPDALLTAPEARSSSPVRIIRDFEKQSSIKGIYPAGEGAGYAGGIMSAAVDGIKSAEALIERIEKYE